LRSIFPEFEREISTAQFCEFFRNDALDARNYFNAAPSPVGELRYNLYGFNFSGPVTFGKFNHRCYV
jgi:hypothetical protein